jgi:nucleoside diphosphate kinase
MSLPRFSLTTCLTANNTKLAVYAHDSDFVRAFASMQACWGVSDTLRHRLWNCAGMLLRPDAIAAKNSVAVMHTLRQQGLVPLLARVVMMSSEKTGALWHYQANVSTAERIELLRRLMLSGPSLFVVLRDDRTRILSPATVHLTYLKGPTLAAKRKPGHLRTIAGPVLANLISYIHASDDPADLVREMGLLFDDNELRDVLQEIDAWEDRTVDVCSLIARLEGSISEDLCFAEMGSTAACIEPFYGPLNIRQNWEVLIGSAIRCRSFVTGETYDTMLATVPDDKRLSLPLDRHLTIPEIEEP